MDKKLLSLIKKAAIAGGDVLVKRFNTAWEGINDVTTAERAAEKIIIQIIENIFPQHNIRSEEKGEINKKSEYTWIIDPLDGTGNFIRHIPLFGNSIALEHKGETILGIVYLPITKELFWAFKGEGAYLNDKALVHLQTSKKKAEELLVTFDHGHKTEDIKKMMDYFLKIRPHVADMRKLGASTVEITSIVKGVSDAYIAPGLPISNFEAASLIVTEVGGTARTSKDGTIYIFAPGVERILSTSLR